MLPASNTRRNVSAAPPVVRYDTLIRMSVGRQGRRLRTKKNCDMRRRFERKTNMRAIREYGWSPSPMGTRNPRKVTSALPMSPVGLRCLIEKGVGRRMESELMERKVGCQGMSHWNSHSLDEIQQRSQSIHSCVLLEYGILPVVPAHFRATAKLTTVWLHRNTKCCCGAKK
ncbi:hypothetical protein EVAR_3448_1 [Eumeta japonica]|uniref:Uncharacterized protein n=1 Tax=Eumeta variegata TaxID=151549 RepID=A0A4C1SSH9_EUMVA|nr:hypothetical protein EVAR_3448_1 [Eumeta japonica]